jgi:hypothetical protein
MLRGPRRCGLVVLRTAARLTRRGAGFQGCRWEAVASRWVRGTVALSTQCTKDIREPPVTGLAQRHKRLYTSVLRKRGDV